MSYDYVDWKIMSDFVIAAFEGYGVPPEDARICADVLLEADRRGIESHGVNRFKPIYIDRIKEGIQSAVTKIDVVKETCTTAVLDGNDGMGQVIAKRAMGMAIEKAKQYGMGMVAVRNSTHIGIVGYYVTMATGAGCVGIAGTNARPSIAPTYGIENMLGTNPITFGLPTDEDFPFVLDCATSITQRGTVEIYARTGENAPEGQVIGADGKVLTDSASILKALTDGTAALAPLGGTGTNMGGYKGYGYATVVEVLSAALQSGSYLKMLSGFQDGKKVKHHLGHFFLAVDCDAFMGLDEFKKTSGEIMRALRASKKAPGHDRIYTAGEIEYEKWQERKKTGLPVNKSVQSELIAIRDELKMDIRFPFE